MNYHPHIQPSSKADLLYFDTQEMQEHPFAKQPYPKADLPYFDTQEMQECPFAKQTIHGRF